MRNQYRYIGEQGEWDAVAEELRQAPRLALDTERNGRFAYRERICLIQISDGRGTYLLDPLSVRGLDTLGESLADEDVMIVMHGCEEDVRYFDRDFGFEVSNLFDTGLAARFLGVSRPNLGAVLEEFCGVGIVKDPKLQVSHWGLRPLSGPALDYAASDVHHLLPLADELEYRLDKLGRVGWVREECARIESLRHPPEEPLETAFRRVKGWESLNPREAAVLQELYAFRDGKACAWGRSPDSGGEQRRPAGTGTVRRQSAARSWRDAGVPVLRRVDGGDGAGDARSGGAQTAEAGSRRRPVDAGEQGASQDTQTVAFEIEPGAGSGGQPRLADP